MALHLSKDDIDDHVISKIINEFVPTIAIIRYAHGTFSNRKAERVASSEGSYLPVHLLVVLNGSHSKGNEANLISAMENKLLRITKSTVLIHSLDFVNEGLSRGQDFFIDIIEKGIAIYKSDAFLLTTYFRIHPRLKLGHIKKTYNNFHLKGAEFLKLAYIAYSKFNIHISVFLLHQSTELLMRNILITHTDYDPKIHNLRRLITYCNHVAPQINRIFFPKWNDPLVDNIDFNLLQESYIQARYKLEYHIDKKSVRRLLTKAKKLERLSSVLQGRLCTKLSAQF
ncbi:HEPN domain-containing protein [Sphingobacterium thalpophilum]|uniref:HEPN domain n=1 Tax=Sphingobacterium thalpophilum TaxID=259 RepID=A0A4U9UYI6_9SPHI|nr:HEPN domain-containing protein [Sphingobacterium thalpophilum]VTR37469.1 HEPN domain [Sphingobacterium thalpophilum]